jgi:hypothetical protein
VFRDFLGTIANIDDESLEAELISSRGKHPKWNSLVHEESFQLDATEYVREHGSISPTYHHCIATYNQSVP